jgi:hypothetical protein
VDWTPRTTTSTLPLTAVGYGGGTFVAWTWGGAILTSSDGITWTGQNDGVWNEYFDAAYGSSTFVSVGRNGEIAASADGSDWVIQNSPTVSNLNKVEYLNGIFVAVGSVETVLTSADGTAWDLRNEGGFVNAPVIEDVAYGGGEWVAVGSQVTGSGIIYSSNNLAVSSTLVLVLEPSSPLKGLAYGNGTFVAVGDDDFIMTSSNAAVWTSLSTGPGTTFYEGVAFGNGTFVAVGNSGTIMTSPMGAVWTTQTSGTTEILRAVTFGNDLFVAVGGVDGNGIVLSSPDGVTWTAHDAGTNNLGFFGVANGDDTFLALSSFVTLQSDPFPPGSGGGGGGGGGGCKTAGPVQGEPVWPDLFWIVLLFGVLIRVRTLKANQA